MAITRLPNLGTTPINPIDQIINFYKKHINFFKIPIDNPEQFKEKFGTMLAAVNQDFGSLIYKTAISIVTVRATNFYVPANIYKSVYYFKTDELYTDIKDEYLDAVIDIAQENNFSIKNQEFLLHTFLTSYPPIKEFLYTQIQEGQPLYIAAKETEMQNAEATENEASAITHMDTINNNNKRYIDSLEFFSFGANTNIRNDDQTEETGIARTNKKLKT